MVQLFLDTEFDSFGGPLLSIALVSECGKQFYEVLEHGPIQDPWVAVNVVPYFMKPPIPREKVIERMYDFLRQFIWKDIVIVADWPDDIIHICKLFITGPGTATKFAGLNFKLIRCDYVSQVPHNALYDAMAIREVELEKQRKKDAPKI